MQALSSSRTCHHTEVPEKKLSRTVAVLAASTAQADIIAARGRRPLPGPKVSMTRLGGAFLSACLERQNRADIANARQSPALPRSITLREQRAVWFRARLCEAQ